MEKVLAAAAIVQQEKSPALPKNWELLGLNLHFCPRLSSLGSVPKAPHFHNLQA